MTGGETWGIEIDKEYLKFSAAHFLIFPDGSAERLHGHNYRIYVAVEGALTEHGLVMDFKRVKPVVKELADELDEHWLVPGRHPVLRWRETGDGAIEVRYQERLYLAPRADVIVLPINNTSAENLAGWLGQELLRRLRERFPDADIRAAWVAVEETPGQRGTWRWRRA